LLTQLSDRQLRDLFEAARFDLRRRAPDDVATTPATIGEWIGAFKEKRDDVVGVRCPSA